MEAVHNTKEPEARISKDLSPEQEPNVKHFLQCSAHYLGLVPKRRIITRHYSGLR